MPRVSIRVQKKTVIQSRCFLLSTYSDRHQKCEPDTNFSLFLFFCLCALAQSLSYLLRKTAPMLSCSIGVSGYSYNSWVIWEHVRSWLPSGTTLLDVRPGYLLILFFFCFCFLQNCGVTLMVCSWRQKFIILFASRAE